MRPKILIIEDDEALSVLVRRVLETEDYAVATATTAEEGLARVPREDFDAVLTDLQLPGASGLEVIRGLQATHPQLPVILMTGHSTAENTIEATKLGAYDYVVKGGNPELCTELLERVGQAVASHRLMQTKVELAIATATQDAIVGRSRPMQEVYKEIGRIAPKPVTVLIRGETGTGKELVARALHQHSTRAQQPFITVNCVAIPETLLESELFGHEPGAFTGAQSRRIGRFEQADHGTILLDEIGDLSPNTQAKLLRVLQEHTLQRLGGKATITVDVRVLASTHRNLETAIREGQFREDLYYRLNVATITLPPLRDHREDIPALVRYFLGRYGTELGVAKPVIQDDALEVLRSPTWPGNVRELENVVRKALLLARSYPITQDIIAQVLLQSHGPQSGAVQSLAGYVSQLLDRAVRGDLHNVHEVLHAAIERELYTQAIALARGNQAKAAQWLGISRPTMREKLRQYGLHPTDEPAPP